MTVGTVSALGMVTLTTGSGSITDGPYQGSVTFAQSGTGDTITRNDGGSWAGYGYQAGQQITVSGAVTSGNNTTYTIQSVSGDMLVLTVTNTVTPETDPSVTVVDNSIVNITAQTLNLTAANGIGTSGAPLETSVNTLTTATASGGGLFLSNNKTLTVTSASASGGAVSITTVGDLDVGSVTAAGQAVTLSAAGALIDPNGPELNVTAETATLSGSSIGEPGDPLETKVSFSTPVPSITATATAGVVYISDLGTGSLTLTASAAGAGADIDFTSAGSIVLNTVSRPGHRSP